MKFILTNEHRKFMGIPLIKDSYIMETLITDYADYYLFFEDNTLVKVISVNDKMMYERNTNYEVSSDHKYVLPKTKKGKIKKLTIGFLNSDNFRRIGPEFFYYYSPEKCSANIDINNYTNHKVLYQNENIKDVKSLEQLEKWCDEFIKNITYEDLQEIENFKNGTTETCKFKVGDYFRVKVGMHEYTYGRILEYYQENIEQDKKINLLSGTVVYELFHILTNRKDVKIEELRNLKTLPSQNVFDFDFKWGKYQIIGNEKLPDNLAFPIYYEKIKDEIVFQCGQICKSIKYKEGNLIRKKLDESFDFRSISEVHTMAIESFETFVDSGVSFYIHIDRDLLLECIKENSNNPYWKAKQNIGNLFKRDLRNPKYKSELIKILQQFEVEYLIENYNN